MEYSAYLFAHFIGEQTDGEQIYFSVSRDGLRWRDLNDGKPVLYSNVGELGARDPFLIRSPWAEEKKYYLIATDLRIEAGKGWEAAQYSGSRDILIWESEDLVSWKGPKAHTIGIEGAGCVWAPEAIYDESEDAILVFWASMVERKQRIYAAYTKDETTKNIVVDFAKTLKPEDFKEIPSETLSELYGVEGPEIFKFNDREEWCLIVDRFATGKGYLPLVTKSLKTGAFTVLNDTQFDMGVTKKRHGGIIPITEEEYQRLCK